MPHFQQIIPKIALSHPTMSPHPLILLLILSTLLNLTTQHFQTAHPVPSTPKLSLKVRNNGNAPHVMHYEATSLTYGLTHENAPFSSVQQHERNTQHLDTRTIHSQSLYHEKLTHQPSLSYIYNSFKNSTLFAEVNRYNIAQYIQHQDKVLVMWILCDCDMDDAMDWDLRDLEELVKQRYQGHPLQFLYIHQSEAEHFKLGDRFMLERVPTMIIDNIPASGVSNEKYVYEDPKTGYQGFRPRTTVHDVLNFLDRFLRGTLPMVIQSENVHPMPQAGEVWHVVASNFVSLVLENKKDVLLLIYSPYCTGCVAVLPIFTELAASLKNVPNIVIATLDKTKNDIPVRGLPVHYLPTVYFFPGNNKEKRIDFREYQQAHKELYFDQEGLVKFLREHATVPISDADLEAMKEKEYSGAIKVLTPENFQETVYDKTKDVVLLIHAPWCPHCVRFYPTYQKLAEELQSDENIVITQLDGSKHREIGDKYHQGYPTVLLFSQKNKVRPSKFTAARSLPVLLQWCKDNRDTESPLPSQRFFRVFYTGEKIRWYKYHQDAYFEREVVLGKEDEVRAPEEETPSAEQTEKDLPATGVPPQIAAIRQEVSAAEVKDSTASKGAPIVWKEYENGKQKASFVEESFDKDTLIAMLFDKTRNMYVKLTKDKVSWSHNKQTWHEFDKGGYYGSGLPTGRMQ